MERKLQGDRRVEDRGLCILFWLPSSLKLRRDKTTQHVEAPLNASNTHPINQSRFCCQDFFTPGLQLHASLSPPGADRFYSSNALGFYAQFVFDDSD
jgi:hypothetical protein